MLEKRVLGKTGIYVSRLCFGSLTLGPLQANLTHERASELILYAYERGINFFDTAQFYRNYPHLKAGFSKLPGDVVLTSKSYAYTAEQAFAAVDEARTALNRDVIDIFMLHEQESEHTFRGHADALDALYTLKARGILRAVGASTHYIAGVRAATKLGLDVIHPLINRDGLGIVDGSRKEMEAAISAAHSAGIGIYTMKALGGGNLFSKASECFNYALSLPFADSIAVGMQSEEEISANINYFNNETFTPEDLLRLSQKSRKILIEDWCTGCGSCIGACSQNALQLSDGRSVCNRNKCILCGYCSGHCPEWAIKII